MKIPRTKTYSIYKKLVLQDKRSLKLNFNPDGREYYVYRVTDIDTKEYYYGSRISKKDNLIDDFWSYCTSSKRKNLIKENKESYKVKVIKTFNNKRDLYMYESFLHQYFNVKNNIKFWNESNITPFGFYPSDLAYKIAGNKQKTTKSSLAWKKLQKPHPNLNKKLVYKKDKSIILVNCSNIKYTSIFKDTIMTNQNKRVSKEVFISDNLKGVAYGFVTCVDNNGIRKRVTVKERNEKKLDSIVDGFTVIDEKGEFIRVTKESYNKEKHTGVRKGKTVAKDIEGNTFSIDINDERLKLGTLVNVNQGTVTAFNKDKLIIEVISS